MNEDVKLPLPRSLQEIVGSLLFASEVPLTATEVREAIRAVETEDGENKEVMEVYRTCTSKEIEAALRGLEKALDVGGVGFKLVCTAGAYRLQTLPSCGRYVRAMLKLDRPSRLGRASLETLAIIAYRQPITKSEIEDIRGVDVSANIKTLLDLQLIRLVGKSELPGHPFLYGTTPLFLDHFGLSSLQQLNELDPTLQRSNPRQKAAQYKRPDKQELPVQPEAEPAAEVEAGSAVEAAEIEDLDGIERDEDDVRADVPESVKAVDDDDFVIDDTPDEFDDDDDDDEDDDEGEEAEDEADAGADGADDVDGV